MELRDVKTFLVLAEELHFGRTAARLHVTQGRVSQMIKALEREVGGALFDRSSRRVRLTHLGELFHSGVSRGYNELTRTLDNSRAAARTIYTTLRVGYLPAIGVKLLTEMAVVFETRHPRGRVMLNALALRQIISPDEPLRQGDADVIVCWAPGGDGRILEAPGLTVGPVLGYRPRAVLMPVGHPLAHHDTVSLDDLVGYELINPSNAMSDHVSQLWTPRRTPSGRLLRHTSDDITSMTGRAEFRADDVVPLVARGRGLHCTVTTLLTHFPFHGLRVVPIRDMPPMAIVPVWLTADDDTAIRAFVDTAMSINFATQSISD